MNNSMIHNEIALMDQRRMHSGKEPTAAELYQHHSPSRIQGIRASISAAIVSFGMRIGPAPIVDCSLMGAETSSIPVVAP